MRMGEQKTGSILTCWAIISIFCSGAIWSSIVYLKLSHRSWNVEPDAWSLKSSAGGGLLRRERWASTPWIVLCPRKRKTGVTWKQSGWMMKLRSSEKSLGNAYLVGGLEHEFYDFPFSWECHHINWQTPSFFRGVGTPPTRYCIIYRYIYI